MRGDFPSCFVGCVLQEQGEDGGEDFLQDVFVGLYFVDEWCEAEVAAYVFVAQCFFVVHKQFAQEGVYLYDACFRCFVWQDEAYAANGLYGAFFGPSEFVPKRGEVDVECAGVVVEAFSPDVFDDFVASAYYALVPEQVE